VKEIKVPTAPNSVIVMKLRKNCFFFTWNLVKEKKKERRIADLGSYFLVPDIQ